MIEILDIRTCATEMLPCEVCTEPTIIRFNKKPGHFKCIGERELAVANSTAPAPRVKTAFLEVLHEQFGPKKKVQGKVRGPWWAPPMPQITDLVRTSGWAWSRPFDGEVAILDRNAAFLAGASSVDVAHGCLVHSPDERVFHGLPGFYKVVVQPWAERHIPHPLGAAGRLELGSEVWVPHPRAQLLQRLADQGRYPEGSIIDAYTSGRDEEGRPRCVRLNKWAGYVNDVRADVLRRCGAESEEYDRVKRSYGQAFELMCGKWEPGKGRSFNPSVKVRRPDWGMAAEDQTTVTLWNWADDCHQVMTDAGCPDLVPVGLRNVDELLVPAAAVDTLITVQRAGGRAPLRLDQEGVQLGTFKIKGFEHG